MARYVVIVTAGDRTASLLVILSPSQLCSALVDAVKARLASITSKLNLPISDNLTITLHLENTDGPILDPEDLLSDVLPDVNEVCCAVIEDGLSLSDSQLLAVEPTDSEEKLRIRVITPALARSHTDINKIDPVSEPIALTCTLRDLQSRVARHLDLAVPPAQDLECNCLLARRIEYGGASLKTDPLGDVDALHTLIVVYGDSQVVTLPIKEPTLAAMESTTMEQLKEKASGKLLRPKGGIEKSSNLGSQSYIKLPVLAVCSTQSHERSCPEENYGGKLNVDIHTTQCPIEVTAHNAGITLAASKLFDCAVDGVLNVFAVPRLYSMVSNKRADAEFLGKARVFQQQLAWETPSGQSDRGLSNLLSTLRVFAHLTSSHKMEAKDQDAVLHVLYLLTRFPPAVRAMHVLMRGETPQLAERAALSQCLYEVLRDVVPISVIKSDGTRFLEGSRLLMGLVLAKAKQLEVLSTDSHGSLAYVDARVYDLRNAISMEPVRGVTVQTQVGLLETGCYDAFAKNGPLAWTDGNVSTDAPTYDDGWSRAAILSGGTKSKIVVFDADAVTFGHRYAEKGDVNKIIARTELTNLQYLANLCSLNGLGVSPPSALLSTTPPILTLDRLGSLAVYVGRQGCGGEAGKDVLMFRPTAGEEAVDTSIITQLQEPILTRHTADGTMVFETFGENHRQLTDPTEAIMFCVDLSNSMNSRCDFLGIQENEDPETPECLQTHAGSQSTVESLIEDAGSELLTLEELKEYLVSHESFSDFLAIVRTGQGESGLLANGRKALDILHQLDQQQIQARTKGLDRDRLRASSAYYRSKLSAQERDLSSIKNRIARMRKYCEPLAAFLVYRAENGGQLPEIQTWRPGRVPKVPKTEPLNFSGPTFKVPTEYLCPISSEVMENPVSTVDGFTYERKEYREVIEQSINTFFDGTSVPAEHPILQDSRIMTIKAPLGSWTKKLPDSATMSTLYELVFRLTKGRYSKFELRHKSALLPFSTATVSEIIDHSHSVYVIPQEAKAASAASTETEDLCLVKIYDESSTLRPRHAYWERKNTTKTLASVVFSYYRHIFSQHSSTIIGPPFIIWRNLYNAGDGNNTGWTENHWENLSGLLNYKHGTGNLNEESLYDSKHAEGDWLSRSMKQQPIVLKLQLGNPPTERRDPKYLSRLDVLKQTFDAFINRVLAYNFQTHIGLVTFGTTASLSQGITHTIENFRRQLSNVTAEGDTALWNSIALANDSLLEFHRKFPKAKLRIICISDGEDNIKGHLVHNLAAQLARDNVVVDSICLGDTKNADLQTLSYMTGGYKFQPEVLEEAMAICEMEPVLSLWERPAVELPVFYSSRLYTTDLFRFQKAKEWVEVDLATRDQFLKRKEHPQLAESFVELGNFARRASSQSRSDSNQRLSRTHTEMRNCGAHPHPFYDIYICESNFGLWKVVMEAPPEDSYTGGTFLFYIEMEADYPMFPPKARFVTQIYHPNINRHGRICHSILDRNWTADTTTKDVIDTIYSLLLVPEFSDPINTVVTLNYHWDEAQFKEEVQRSIQKHAKKTRAEWREDIAG